MGNERLLQILDNSACLTSRQLDHYLKHTLFPEELRVVELHLSGCPFCSDALDGLEQQQHQLSVLLGSLSLPALPDVQLPEKIKEKKEPEPAKQVKTGSTPYRHYGSTKTNNTSSFNKWKMPVGVAAALLIGFGALWLLKFKKDGHEVLAVNMETATDSDTGLNSEAPALATPESIAEITTTTEQGNKKPVDTVKQQQAALSLKQADSNPAPAMAVVAAPATKEQAAVNEFRDTEKIQQQQLAAAQLSKEKSLEKVRAQAATKEEDNDPPAARSNYKIGLEQYNQKEYEKALGYFKQAESDPADPNHWNAVYYTGMSYKALGKKRKAIRQFKQIVDSENQSRKAAAQKQLEELK